MHSPLEPPQERVLGLRTRVHKETCTDRDLLSWELSNYVANSAMTHLPQVKSMRIIELGLLLFLNPILHTIPNIIMSNSDCKCLFGRGADDPAEQRDSSRHESVDDCSLVAGKV